MPRELELAATALIVIGCASIVYGGVLAVSRRTAAETLAYSAIGQVGYVLVAIGVGGRVGFAAAVAYTVVNALNKTLLFLTVGMRGALVGAAFALGAFSVAGLPPAAGFVGKLELFRAVAHSPTLIVLFFAGGVLSFVYIFQIYQYDFWRGERTGPRSSRAQQALVAGLALLVLAGGAWPEPVLALSHDAAQVLAGGAG
jgi:multicomponent Na+:H+ antiporter subunit D